MSLLRIVRSAVEIANKVTKPLQATVMYERVTGSTGFGDFNYASPVPLKAIVDFNSKQVRTRQGVLTVTRATIEILDIAQLVAVTGGEGVGNDDRFTLPDGDSGPTLDIGGFIDSETGHPIATQVMIG